MNPTTSTIIIFTLLVLTSCANLRNENYQSSDDDQVRVISIDTGTFR